MVFFYKHLDEDIGPTVSDFTFDGTRLQCNLSNIPVGSPVALSFPNSGDILKIDKFVKNEY